MTPSLRRRLLAGGSSWAAGTLALATCIALAVFRSHLDRAGEPALHPQINFTSLLVIGLLSLVLLVAGVAIMLNAVRPLHQLRVALASVHGGEAASVAGSYPTEIQPLVDDLNRLLHDNQEIVTRARAAAANLAHGLKTPLAVLANEELPSPLRQQVDAMQQTISHHLARARAATPSQLGERCSVARSIERLIRAMRTIYPGCEVTGESEPLFVQCNPTDLEEMAGNLLDNACRWARSTVSVVATNDASHCVIEIRDDGPGMTPEAMRLAMEWGERGFGIAIARSLAESVGGQLGLSSPDGLSARLRLPLA